MVTISVAPIQFTTNAVEEVKRLMNEEGFDRSQKLRVGVKGGGCSGMTYVLGFDLQLEDDEVYDYEGMEFYPIISSALDLFMEEATTIGVNGNMLNIYSNKDWA